MLHFKKGNTENGYGEEGIILDERIFSLSKDSGKIVIREECDGYFYKELSTEDAVALFQEAINWIESNSN